MITCSRQNLVYVVEKHRLKEVKGSSQEGTSIRWGRMANPAVWLSHLTPQPLLLSATHSLQIG